MKGANLKAFEYARQSTDEAQNRQVNSIPDQISDLRPLEKDRGLEMVDFFEEQKSAKAPHIRPLFEEMLTRIERGEADVIVCWHVNRLARNPVDAGKVIWLLQTGVIKQIITPHHTYLPEDSSILLALESAMANEYVRDLSKIVKARMQKKAEDRKTYPGRASLGYSNFRSAKVVDIRPDDERWDDVRGMWDLLLSGKHTVPQIQRIATDDWQLRNRYGNPICLGGLYKLFSNIFYTGMFEWKGEVYEGSHKPMITLEEFDLAQRILGRKGRPRNHKHQSAYTGLIRCGECGDLCTYTEKWKQLASTGEWKRYRYIHCQKHKRDSAGKAVCSQRPIRVEDLEKQIMVELEKFTVSPKFAEWAVAELDKRYADEVEDRTRIREQQEQAYSKIQRQLDTLLQMRYRELIDDEEYTVERRKLKIERAKIKETLDNSEQRADAWQETSERAFHFVSHAKAAFEHGSIDDKKTVFAALGSNYVLKDQMLSIEAVDWLVPLIDHFPELETKYQQLEPEDTTKNKGRNAEIVELILLVCSLVENVRTAIEASRNGMSQIPSLAAFDDDRS